MTSNSRVTARNEAAGDSKDLRGRERDVEGLWNSGSATEDVEDSLMACFDSQNRRGSAKQLQVRY